VKAALAIIIVAYSSPVLGQGTFQNLDFESANIPASTPAPSLVPISEALPGWNAYLTADGVTYPQTEVYYDAISLGDAAISIDDAKVSSPLQGNYSAFLFGGAAPPTVPGGSLYSASISQTGTVPAGTQSLQFDAYVSGAPFAVTLGGQTIDMIPLDTLAHYTLWGGNIPSALADQSETLSFIEPPATGTQPSMFELDNITFSTTAVPEPNSIVLTGIGGLIFAWYRRRLRCR
jgi:hypothetical protein